MGTQSEALARMRAKNRDTSGDRDIYSAPPVASPPERDIRAEAMRTGRPEDLDAAPIPVQPAPVATPKRKVPAAGKVAAGPAARPAPKVDDLAEVRADLLANQRADEAARALAERKRQEAEDFSKRLKAATARPAASKTGYDSYKSLMGE